MSDKDRRRKIDEVSTVLRAVLSRQDRVVCCVVDAEGVVHLVADVGHIDAVAIMRQAATALEERA